MSLNELKLKINQLKRELVELEQSNNPVPELINSTNLLRSNEILSKTNDKKTELLGAYESYLQELDSTLKKIQDGFKTLRARSSSRKKPSKGKIRRARKKPRKRKNIRKKPRKRKPIKRKR